MNAVAERILLILVDRFKERGADNFDLNKELEFIDPVSERGLTKEEKVFVKDQLLLAIKYKESHDGAVLIPVSVVSDPRDHEEWYDEWLAIHNDYTESYYWKRLENFLSHELTLKYGAESAGELVRSIDEATLSIMKKLSNPRREEFSYKGLVVGYVQSGKTANFTALIAKAADAGYKLIIVLAGIHNVLRRQTQVRLDRELTGVRDIEGPDKYISLPGAARAWNRLTTAHNDFSTANLGLFANYCQLTTPTLAVVKKNVTVLNRLIDYFSHASVVQMGNMPVLIIDDEADQASIDTNANNPNPDIDPSRTNACIRNLLRLFPKKAYVGYTATPFANVLIDMATEDDNLEDDLYPRNFIVSLPEPNDYFGSSTVFRGNLSQHFIDEVPIMINGNPHNELREIIRNRRITNSLSTAIDQFFLSCAVRNIRGDRMRPMSMLIHVSHRIADMDAVASIINSNDIIRQGYVPSIIARYSNPQESRVLKEQYRTVWLSFIDDCNVINDELGRNNIIPEYDEVWAELQNVFDVLRIFTLNSTSADTLDYTSGEEIKVIAIGGNQLSRGLTLEGLMTSYYLRTALQYDTLLQMGRWFGYRLNYEDLTRIHTTREIWSYFSHLAQVEEELRRDIRRYESTDNTPADLAVTILTHSRLTVTAPNKMGAADLQQTSYSDSLHQTFKFPLDISEKLRSNLNIGNSFISRVREDSTFKESWVPGVFVTNNTFSTQFIFNNFLDRYNFEERFNGSGIDIENLRSYAFRRDRENELQNWRIALAGNSRGEGFSLGGQSFNKINRSRIQANPGYDCGVISDKRHLLADLSEHATSRSDGRDENSPLLLIYIINKDSLGERPGRVDLYHDIESEMLDVLAFAIVLPKSTREPYNRIGQ
jgi:hypothetical protein